MSTVIYRLAVPEQPWYLDAHDFVRDMPGWAKTIGAIGAIASIPTLAVVGLEAAAATGIVALGAVVVGAVGLEGRREPLNIWELTAEQAEAYRDDRGRPIVPKKNYLEHPKLTSTLISTPNYHEIIVKEQSAHLMAYIRATVPVRRICISISYGNSAELTAKALWFSFGGVTKAEGKVISDCKYEIPEQTAMPDGLYWMTHFPTVIEGLRRTRGGGKVALSEAFERGAHVNVDAASKIGLDIRATFAYRLNIDVEFR